MTSNNTIINRDFANNKIIVTRSFNAIAEEVWKAWTHSDLLERWWAPKPYSIETKTLDFSNGGHWHYAMISPQGEKNWVLVGYDNIIPVKSFETVNSFCDEKGNKSATVPPMHMKNNFRPEGQKTTVIVEVTCHSESDIKQIVDLGFEKGFASALDNLEQYLQEGIRLRRHLKTNSAARVVTYLNFPGNTEEAMNFYSSVFGTEISGGGVKRFGDIPADSGHPPVADSVKDMVLHAELPITAHHVLMATDAPKEMGFTLTTGNNMHICIEPESREETKRLFDMLSEGGNVSMPLMDMFFGAYFGEFTDKYGINWMVSFTEKNKEV